MKSLNKILSVPVFIAVVYLYICIISLLPGLGDGMIEGKCEYHTILSKFNLGYVIGCELTEKRY